MQTSHRLETLFWRWTERRSPRARQVTLRHRSIYVVPSLSSLGFLLATVLLWLLGTNYQNNLILATSFFLIALFFITILHAFQNLSGIKLSGLNTQPGFCGEIFHIAIEVAASAQGKDHYLTLTESAQSEVSVVVPARGVVKVNLPVQTQTRGWLSLGRLMVKSHYPLGLTRVWSWVYLDAQALVYPQPKPAQLALHFGADGDSEDGARLLADDDFIGFADYQPGAPLTHVAWKQYARGGELQLKQYGGAEQDSLWLDYQRLMGDVETRLSGLCYLALQWQKSGRDYGLLLPGLRIEPACGESHLHKVLKALALFDLRDVS
ncbi:DUF58 domain-containing protein [Gilvimarinus sp. 1_MG-2023]|uniref:DUF58 domain-containing protein n=1 Tax=Gilvimarinus sp. 1_MG-2023 TaxID=3062638 RepID=UPI0026E409CE|nr:DUF58 domain-containing protein [Gilvimarinus sp. 1_MG-2023]MDO6747258.1 DUF58 domain-containing protein [Gilvimarinus sp. 1_MG-2023]